MQCRSYLWCFDSRSLPSHRHAPNEASMLCAGPDVHARDELPRRKLHFPPKRLERPIGPLGRGGGDFTNDRLCTRAADDESADLSWVEAQEMTPRAQHGAFDPEPHGMNEGFEQGGAAPGSRARGNRSKQPEM